MTSLSKRISIEKILQKSPFTRKAVSTKINFLGLVLVLSIFENGMGYRESDFTSA